ncbi:threonylcarbamoyl-AMP synthase isoform X2 [Cuculus canorus]|uniref:threonylcarbamoyl-AMP synthase isoform X2 n=1 Tax=Cuculus canorus TaxID=55661 RepID=UPI0023AAC23C|nr:threonylcarbamoyl-AMP synthase isoform X2 [Cuculus canorus]
MRRAAVAALARVVEGAPGLGFSPGGSACGARLLLPPGRACPGDHTGWREVVATTARALLAGGLVAVPTDTVYGVACLAQDTGAVQSIYRLKGRDGGKPLAICLGEVDHIHRYCQVNVPDELLRDLLPGPVTLVLKRSEELNKDLNPFTSEFQDLWPHLSLIIDGGPIGDVQSPECRLGSTVVDLSVPGKFIIIRPGCALTSTVEILRQKYGLIPGSS